jgi:hypothetical protein
MMGHDAGLLLGEIDEADFREGGRFHPSWLELTRMILERDDRYETASDLAKRVIVWAHDREIGYDGIASDE